MRLTLFTLRGCYPCERAKSVLSRYFKDYSIEYIECPHQRCAQLGIVYKPSLLIENGNEQIILTGAHNITKIEIDGAIADLANF